MSEKSSKTMASTNSLERIYTRKEAHEAVRLQLTLNDDIASGLHRFCVACTASLLTICALLALFYYAASTQRTSTTLILFVACALMAEGAAIHHLWQYNPVRVYRMMLHQHKYGLILSAMKRTRFSNEFTQ